MTRMVAVFSFEKPETPVEFAAIVGTLQEFFQEQDAVKSHLTEGRAAAYIMDLLETGLETRSPLVEHAKKELSLIGEEEDDGFKESIVRAISGFCSYGHSGGSAPVAIAWINVLLQFKNLTPLTDDPKEWMLVGNGTWQSVRNSEAFSKDGGKTYYLLSEGGNDQNPEPLHKSEEHYVPEESKD